MEDLLSYCELFAEATLETDMAKRVFLSIIPATMSAGERHHSGGYDYKALRSASNGAKDLTHFGTQACIAEVKHYTNLDPDEDITLHPLYIKAHKAFLMGKNLDALNACHQAFSDKTGWMESYGGGKWQVIAETLIKIETARLQLEHIRREAASHPEQDNLSLEVAAMKTIITEMNIFDGLAHNTAGVMQNLISLEADEHGFAGTERETKLQQRVQSLMDSKELRNPYDVYREVEHIITLPENKHLFGDFIQRINQDPLSREHNPTAIEQEKLRIRIKKDLMNEWPSLNTRMTKLISLKDQLTNAKNDDLKVAYITQIGEQFHKVMGRISGMIFIVSKKYGERSMGWVEGTPMGKELTDIATAFVGEADRLYDLLRREKDSLIGYKGAIRTKRVSIESVEVQLTSAVYRIRKLYANLENAFHQF